MAITAQELLARIEARERPLVVDVRSDREFASGHVPGAVNIPFLSIGARAAEIRASHDEPVVVYCEHGPRAWIAGRSLRRQGFKQVVYLKGHMSGWRKAGLRQEQSL